MKSTIHLNMSMIKLETQKVDHPKSFSEFSYKLQLKKEWSVYPPQLKKFL